MIFNNENYMSFRHFRFLDDVHIDDEKSTMINILNICADENSNYFTDSTGDMFFNVNIMKKAHYIVLTGHTKITLKNAGELPWGKQ